MTSRTVKLSISVPSALAEAVRRRVGPRGLSGFIATAIAHELEREQLRGLLSELEEEHGVVSPEALEGARRNTDGQVAEAARPGWWEQHAAGDLMPVEEKTLSLFELDQDVRPDLFNWKGPIPRHELKAWANAQHLDLPEDLVDVWAATGGGDFFESETLLGPHHCVQYGDDIVSVNTLHRNRGLPPNYLIVALGTFLTAIRLSDGAWVLLDEERYQPYGAYVSFSDWYERAPRAEFAVRYGL